MTSKLAVKPAVSHMVTKSQFDPEPTGGSVKTVGLSQNALPLLLIFARCDVERLTVRPALSAHSRGPLLPLMCKWISPSAGESGTLQSRNDIFGAPLKSIQ